MINWDDIYQKIASTDAAIERRLSPTSEEKKKILKARAKQLAQEPTQQDSVKDYLEIVEFLLAYERYGVELSFVREIYPLKDFTPIPCTPHFVMGITNVRGQIISIIDIKKFFELPDKGLTDLNKIIIVRTEEIELGFLADAVLGVRSIQVEDIQPPLPTLTDLRAEYLKGIASDRQVILDVKKLLLDKRIIVHEQVEL
ncbi:MAG: chemotaxis protein CheW [Acidobacteriota bacterium]